MRRGDADGAVTLLERAAADDPGPYLLEELAAARAAAGRLAAAREALLSARSIYPWRLTTKWMLAELALQAGDDDEALRFATELAVTPAKLRNSRALELKRQARRLTERLAGAGDTASGDPGAPRRSMATALRLAGDRAPALRRAPASAPAAHRPALRFLIRNMPERDLLRVDTAFLRRHVAAAHATRGRYRFQEVVPEDVFVRYVVPYSQMGEAPEEWRGYLHDELERFVRAAETPEEAIYALKYEALDHLGVRYTDRYLLRSILAPRETVEWGYYNCYNGSIVLADALRAFGIPSRIVTIPEWVGMAAGHAWVEAHVHGAWRSIGVADLSRLDDSWFHERAARTDSGLPKHRIYAASFERTDLQLPRFGADAWWEDVTERYTPGSGGRS